MSENQKINIEKIYNSSGKPIELTVKTVELHAPTLLERTGVTIESTICGPHQIYKKRVQSFVDEIVLYSRVKGFITLIDQPYLLELKSVYTGRIIQNPIFKELGINSDYRFKNGKELTSKLRKVIHLFEHPSKFAELMMLENKLQGKISGSVDLNDNKRGNLRSNQEFNFDAEGVATDFTLVAPVFLGAKSSHIKIDLFFDPRADGISFYLESTDLISILNKSIDKEITEQLALLQAVNPSLPFFEQL